MIKYRQNSYLVKGLGRISFLHPKTLGLVSFDIRIET